MAPPPLSADAELPVYSSPFPYSMEGGGGWEAEGVGGVGSPVHVHPPHAHLQIVSDVTNTTLLCQSSSCNCSL